MRAVRIAASTEAVSSIIGAVVDDFHIAIGATSSGHLLVVAGEMDYLTAPQFRAAALGLKMSGTSVTLDLEGVTFMDSAGLGELVWLNRYAATHRAGLVLANVPERILQLMRITGLDGLFRTPRLVEPID